MWTAVDTAGLKAKLTKYGSDTYYTLAAGSYVLTEDIDLGNWKLRIAPGKTVSICLNGHTIKTSNRMYGQTLIIITHDENIALQADRIISLDDGRIVKDERIREAGR